MNTTKALIACLTLATVASVHAEPTLDWVQQYGKSGWDEAKDVTVDRSGSVYITGMTGFNVSGGDSDVFVGKYDSSGAFVWLRELGTLEDDNSNSVSVDGSGNVYIAGSTEGNLAGTNASFYSDAFLSKFDSSGALQWTRQWGTDQRDVAQGVSVDDLGNVYVSGYSGGNLYGASNGGYDAFLTKYDASGDLQWARQFGGSLNDSSAEQVGDVAADGLGNVYVTGFIGDDGDTSAREGDAFVAKYDASGAQQWMRTLSGGEGSWASGVSLDGLGNVYLTGTTDWDWEARDFGPFIAKYDAYGALQWRHLQSTTESINGSDVSADGLGNVYIAVHSQVAPNADVDAYLRKYDASGAFQWSQPLSTSMPDFAYGVATNGSGDIYVTGSTGGNLGGINAGGNPPFDVFVAKFVDSQVPEPAAAPLTLLGLLVLGLRRMLVRAPVGTHLEARN